MFVSRHRSHLQRRGIVLVLILGMLGLLALIGVTFATFSGQARVNARNFAMAQNTLSSSELMDYALTQLIDDTSNPLSALRGHSLKRDMYGNDASFNGYLTGGYTITTTPTVVSSGAYSGTYQCITSILLSDNTVYGYNFTRWIVTFPGQLTAAGGSAQYAVGQTFEILYDDASGSGASTTNRVFYLAPVTTVMGARPSYVASATGMTLTSQLIGEIAAGAGSPPVPVNTVFTLDGRYLHAFNGPGMGNFGVYGNFRLNGPLLGASGILGDPNAVGMDEDYDACDLENWFLAIQSADGQVIIPSFHRPALLRASPTDTTFPNNTPGTTATNDWRNTSFDSAARFLRPRAIDHNGNTTAFPDLIPDPKTGKITYDVDNDGDGITDAVWLDLGFPPQRDAQGLLYKPLYAFTIIGMNGRLPLNTAGNLAHRDSNTGNPLFVQASRLGNSPGELDLTFALQNADDRVYRINNPAALPTYSQFDNSDPNNPIPNNLPFNMVSGSPVPNLAMPVNVTQARNILAGTRPWDPINLTNGDANYVMVNGLQYHLPNGIADIGDAAVPASRLTPPVAGRWGEQDNVPSLVTKNVNSQNVLSNYNNPIRAGMSKTFYLTGTTPPSYIYIDADDDNFDTTDPWPLGGPCESGNYYDLSGSLSLPVERIRRFLSPIDAAGDGMVAKYNNAQQNHGADVYGRVFFFKHSRPPGLPTNYNSVSNTEVAPTNPWDVANVTAGTPFPGNNTYHGYEAFRNPRIQPPATSKVPNVNQNTVGLTMGSPELLVAGAPADLPVPAVGNPPVFTDSTANAAVPSFDAFVNSQPFFMSPNLNDADEMRLYQTDYHDAPFGPADLEWLYRQQDSDGASLSSRLAALAPISFLNPLDGLRRRRLFALDSWELNTFVWANDNPGGAFGSGTLPNSTFSTPVSYAPINPSVNAATNASLLTKTLMTGTFFNTPSLAHRDRKINLNYPLPVSDNPSEPTRLKWINDAYQLLLNVLPPLAVDTPEEHAMLSQYLTNVIDFRDPDATITHFISPDIYVRKGTAGLPATLISAANAIAGDVQLEQFGMEYSPVVLNEVLAYSYSRKDSSTSKPTQTNRFFVEMINTLTESGATSNVGGVATPVKTSDLSLVDWDLILVPDDGLNRPDPTTGQVLDPTTFGTTNYGRVPLQAASFQSATYGTSAPQDVVLRSLTSATNPFPTITGSPTPQHYFYVIGNQNPDKTPTNVESGTPTTDQILGTSFDWFNAASGGGSGTVTPVPTLTTNGSAYYWLCLRRPASALPSASLPVSLTGVKQPNPMVVVDAMRFPYMEAGGTGAVGTPDTVKSGTNALYSWQRMQPYRGGHAVASAYDTAVPPTTIDTRYGFTEQMAVPATQTFNTYGLFSGAATGGTGKPNAITTNIYHTLSGSNDSAQNGSGRGAGRDAWDYFPFNDRDFTSVIELLLVPGCPPGLFTKQFVENSPVSPWPAYNLTSPPPLSTTVPAAPPSTPVAGTRYGASNPSSISTPQTYPYLCDEFFYTAASPTSTNSFQGNANFSQGAGPVWANVGGPAGAGWFKMFELFEVPSSVAGAIGDVASGSNYDWYRQDTKPGLLNLNLIIDEEVFLGLMGNAGMTNEDAGMNTTPTGFNTMPWALNNIQMTYPDPVYNPLFVETGQSGSTYVNASISVPKVVTMIDPSTGSPVDFSTVPSGPYNKPHVAAYAMANQGFFDISYSPGGTLMPDSRMKACFNDFLKLRHGGSGYIFGFGTGPVGTPVNTGTPATTNTNIAADRPFRSLSFPDINYTIMRPAALPPSAFTAPAATIATATQPTPFVWDPGIRNPYLYAFSGTTPQLPPMLPPPNPVRRLFEIPDNNSGFGNNAGLTGDVFVNQLAGPYVQTLMSGMVADLTLASAGLPAPANPALGAGGGNDARQHPYFRSEWLQRIANLSTVRTHQYAVWITVGFFEVTRQGDPLMANNPTNFGLAYDQLGQELGILSGRNVRYRSFFVVDRTKATGYNPALPGDFRSAVIYRQTIE